jgi:hypothetical protein
VIVAAAFCPHPPLLVPEVAQGAAPELDDLRSACDVAVGTLRAAGCDHVLVLGGPVLGGPVLGGPVLGGPAQGRTFDDDAVGSLDGFGVPTRFGGGAASVAPTLPLSLTVGAYLLDRVGWSVPRSYVQVGPDPETLPEAAAPETAGRTGVLVMGDGSARRSAGAPGALDVRAEAFDAHVAAALRAGDPAVLRGLDPELGEELLVAGLAAWRTAGALLAAVAWRARVLAEACPYGVGYLVVVWER